MEIKDRGTSVRIATGEQTRDDLKALKRGGESYDCLLQKMIEQYDPDEAPEVYL